MNQRPNLIEAIAEAYTRGENEGHRKGVALGLAEGRKQGIAMERSRIRKVEWLKLAALIFVMTLAAILGAFYITKI